MSFQRFYRSLNIKRPHEGAYVLFSILNLYLYSNYKINTKAKIKPNQTNHILLHNSRLVQLGKLKNQLVWFRLKFPHKLNQTELSTPLGLLSFTWCTTCFIQLTLIWFRLKFPFKLNQTELSTPLGVTFFYLVHHIRYLVASVQIKRCGEMARKLRFFREQMTKAGVSSSAMPLPRTHVDFDDLEVNFI